MKAHVVTHTHWDREWYATFEYFRHRLLELVDSLLEKMRDHPEFVSFLLDGQTVILEDYLELRPEKEQELVDLIRQKRIAVGPWYMLPDEFLVTGEAFIRNYLYGKETARKLGVKVMNIGYLPDMFGHNAYMPAILKGLGLEGAVVWRGVGDLTDRSEFLWRSPSGEEIPVVNLIHGYANVANFWRETDEIKEQFRREIEFFKDRATSDNCLLMNGIDHEIPDFGLPSNFEKWSRELGSEIVHSTVEDYLHAVLRENPFLETLTGELRDPSKDVVLKDVTSSRIYLKLLNWEAEQLYSRYLEPLAVMAGRFGVPVPQHEIDYGWKQLLKSQPHDSICGCSVDRVHQDVLVRLYSSLENGVSTVASSLRKIVQAIGSDYGKESLTVFSPSESKEKAVVRVLIELDSPFYIVRDTSGRIIPSILEEDRRWYFRVNDELSSIGGDDYLKMVSSIARFQSVKTLADDRTRQPYLLTFQTELEPLSLETFSLERAEAVDAVKELSVTEYENDYYSFRLNSDGSFNLTDRESGIEYRDLNGLEDEADVGDEYNFDYIEKDSAIHFQEPCKILSIRDYGFLREIALEKTLTIPAESSREGRSSKVALSIATFTYTLYRDRPEIDVKLVLQNRSKDHRLRMLSVIPFPCDEVINDGYFGLVSHPTSLTNSEDQIEDYVPRYAMESFVYLGGKRGLQILTRGIHEYEVCRRSKETGLYLTLLRSVGWVSRPNLKTRRGEAGPYIETPEGQCIGTYTLSYSLCITGKTAAELYRNKNRTLLKPAAIHHNMDVEARHSMLSRIEGVSLSALKPSSDGSFLLRVFKPGEDQKVYLEGDFESIYLSDMAENKLEGSDFEDIEMNAGEIRSFLFSWKA